MNGLAICAGVGTLELGLKLAIPDYTTVCYIEREAYASAVLVKRMEEEALDKAPIWDNVKTFQGLPWRGKIHIISAGIPCQPWSDAGLQEGVKDERWIWEDVARVVSEVRPSLVFLENVPGLITRGGLAIILADLTSMGYNATWGSLSAAEVGAPHKRERVWILAYTQGTEYEQSIDTRGGGIRLTDSSPVLAHPHNKRQSQPEGFEQESGRRITDGSTEMAHAPSFGMEGKRTSREQIAQVPTREEIPRRDGPRGRSSKVPVPEGRSGGRRNVRGNGLEGNDREAREGGQDNRAGTLLDGSRKWWEVEPDLGRVADGVAFRMDRLRAIGNGVVPVSGAMALLLLAERAGVCLDV